MILAARLIDADQVTFSITDSPDEIRDFTIALMQPAMVHRSTGTFREPELLADLPTRLVSALHGTRTPTPDPGPGPVVVLAVQTASRRAAAVGVFVDAAAAGSWWFQPFNRLARDRDVLFSTVAVGSAAG